MIAERRAQATPQSAASKTVQHVLAIARRSSSPTSQRPSCPTGDGLDRRRLVREITYLGVSLGPHGSARCPVETGAIRGPEVAHQLIALVRKALAAPA